MRKHTLHTELLYLLVPFLAGGERLVKNANIPDDATRLFLYDLQYSVAIMNIIFFFYCE